MVVDLGGSAVVATMECVCGLYVGAWRTKVECCGWLMLLQWCVDAEDVAPG